MPSKQDVEFVTVEAVEPKFGVNDGRFFAEAGTCGDSLQAHIRNDGRLTISVDNPWAGSTESGFGESGYADLPKDAAIALARFILETLGEKPTPSAP